MTKKTCIAVSCFAGLPILGMKNAGFDVPVHLGTSGYGLSSAALNFPDMEQTDSVDEWRPMLDRVLENPADSIIFAQPECAVWSQAGKSHGARDRWQSDPRLANFKSCVDLILDVRPKFAFVESVPLAYSNGRELMVEFAEQAYAVGMSTSYMFVNAVHHKVPQVRKRFFLVFHKSAFRPTPVFHDPVTVREALADVNDPGHYSKMPDKLLPYVQQCGPNESPLIHWNKDNPPETHEFHANGHVKNRPRMMEHRLPLDSPGGVYFGDFVIHPTEDRYLGVNEAKALCAVPQSYQLDGPAGYHFSLLARSVMPPVAQYVGEQALANWDNPILNDPISDFIDHREVGSLFAGDFAHA